MTAKTIELVQLVCDRCAVDQTTDTTDPFLDEERAREAAARTGWISTRYPGQTYDFCGVCVVEALVRPGKKSANLSPTVIAIHTAIDEEHGKIDQVRQGHGPVGFFADGAIADAKYAIRALNRALTWAGQPAYRKVE